MPFFRSLALAQILIQDYFWRCKAAGYDGELHDQSGHQWQDAGCFWFDDCGCFPSQVQVSTRISLCPTPDIFSAIRALVKFTFSGDEYDSKPVTIESSMTEANFSGKLLQASGAIMLAAFLPKCRYVQEYPSVRPLIYFLPSGR